jgi:hypothetical protein
LRFFNNPLLLSFVLSNSNEELLIEHPEKPIQSLFEKPLINLGGFFVYRGGFDALIMPGATRLPEACS